MTTYADRQRRRKLSSASYDLQAQLDQPIPEITDEQKRKAGLFVAATLGAECGDVLEMLGLRP